MATDPVRNTITQIAQKWGVDPNLAYAIALHEAPGRTPGTVNPQAVGDNGTSFGLFQLHQGGELGSLSRAQAFDPATNANVALAEVARQMKAHPGASPGQIAALAQRPADPVGYAARVNATYAQLTGQQLPAGAVANAAAGRAPGAGVNAAALTTAIGQASAGGSADPVGQDVTNPGSGLDGGTSVAAIYSQKCLISTPSFFGIGGGCLLSKAEGKVILGAGLMVAGGMIGLAGFMVLAAFAFDHSGAQQATGRAATAIGTGVALVAPEAGAPIVAAGHAVRRGQHRRPKPAQAQAA